MRLKESPYVVGLREIPAGGLHRAFDLSGVFAKAALADTEAKAEGARLGADLTIFKTGTEVLVRGKIDGELTMVCSRCVAPAQVTLAAPIEVLFLPRDADLPELEDDLSVEQPDVAVYEDEQIDLEETLREEALLALPFAPLCKEGCLGLCATCGKDLNEGPCSCGDSDGDRDEKGAGRFAPLRNLKV